MTYSRAEARETPRDDLHCGAFELGVVRQGQVILAILDRQTIVISDRIDYSGRHSITSQDRLKMAWPTPRTLALIAGGSSLHSQAIEDLLKRTDARPSQAESVAKIYGQTIQAIKRREAEGFIFSAGRARH